MKNTIRVPAKAVIIAAAIIGFSIAIGLGIGAWISDSIWTMLSAIGILLTVAVALLLQWYLPRHNRPNLRISAPRYNPKYLRLARVYGSDEKLCFLDIQILNTGHSTAKRCQPYLSEIWQKDGINNWLKLPQWVPIPLEWVLDPAVADRPQGLPTEKYLVYNMPFTFSLGRISNQMPTAFMLTYYLSPTGQYDAFVKGEYGFKVEFTAENADGVRKYFHVQWDGKYVHNVEEMEKILRVYPKDGPPPW